MPLLFSQQAAKFLLKNRIPLLFVCLFALASAHTPKIAREKRTIYLGCLITHTTIPNNPSKRTHNNSKKLTQYSFIHFITMSSFPSSTSYLSKILEDNESPSSSTSTAPPAAMEVTIVEHYNMGTRLAATIDGSYQLHYACNNPPSSSSSSSSTIEQPPQR